MKLRCIIVDDEPIARKVIEEFVADIPFLELVGKAENPLKATALLHQDSKQGQIDLMFLDIQMPKMNGLSFLKSAKNLPMTILTTAYSEHALEGYALDIVDYLVKPIASERFLKACNKAKELHELRQSSLQVEVNNNYFFAKCNNRYEKILFDELLFIEAANNYVLLHLKDKTLITYLTFKGIEESLPAGRFIRVHKSFIVSLTHIESLDAEGISIGKHRIPISRTLREEVMAKVVNQHLLKR